jgi:phytoene dehydrogenase-like protein
MTTHYNYDAIVIGSGPNGLAAAITLARTGRSVIVYEAKDTIGGGSRSKELTLPGFVHDVCSAIHPLGIASPFMRSLPLDQYGLEWVHSPAQLAHPFDDGSAAVLYKSIGETIATLGNDAVAYQQHIAPLVSHWDTIAEAFLGPLRPVTMMRHSLKLAGFGLAAIRSARSLAEAWFKGNQARALFAGLSAHSMLPLEQTPSAAFGLMLGLSGHVGGWPFPRGGSQHIVDALADYLRSLGGEIITDMEVTSLEMLPSAQTYLFDVTPRQLLRIAGNHLPARYQHQLQRYRYGPGAFKLDYALDGPIPWQAQECTQAGTVHLGNTFSEIAESEWAVSHGKTPNKPYVLVAQQSLFDTTRAPTGKHTAWAYCHVPNGSDFDMTERIEAQIERFAPGFRDRILARHVLSPRNLEHYNANYIGGDINGGAQDFLQLFTRPTIRISPYTTPNRHIYLCSSSTPPGGGVHGICGYYAAQAAIHHHE